MAPDGEGHQVPERELVDIAVGTGVLQSTDHNMSFEHTGRSSLIGRFAHSGP
jgi:hypothetical protein